ncbi:MAG: acetyl-CoA carboxylase, biotin carboxyl carrier protein [Geobacteraceae bacterium GWC2_55_20]|nr:MAG: acetyl-CoA carboxylase, biotin carboxyl carrier protein [Geobacteraceae bacterium GWC2_55_20]OGU23198.1 MAG: acetyl-CoA carboxylase, biotin carboxyl carrier protein [Geobacteraceae bacterium GWF2_54_21]HBA70662.1 acetyl-CoA carboxylase biotin carboxyl carrier protein [Geobacter sp.]HCE69028.1 acetyl-CoA carboxylase biotin carboxyl carrier protein [Geobacter sp.]
MDIKDLKLLIKTVTESDITEFEMDNSEEKIVIKRGHKPEYIQMGAPVMQSYAAPQYAAAPAAAAPAAPAASAAPAPAAETGDTLNSPIVGTFYRAPAPDAAPYVEVGQVVEKGQVLCIVEAMKLMNEIEAECKCKIVKICKENAQAVEFGDPLFVIQKL